MPPIRLPLVITVRDDLAAGPGGQAGEDSDVDSGLQEVHGAVGKHGEGPARVEAVDLAVVGAIDSAGAVKACPVRRGAPAPQQVSRGPRAAGQPSVRDLPAPPPQLRPAGAFGDQDRLGGAVRDVRERTEPSIFIHTDIHRSRRVRAGGKAGWGVRCGACGTIINQSRSRNPSWTFEELLVAA